MARFPNVELSVVIPAYNEEANVPVTLPKAVTTLREMVGVFEILLVNDCSKDRTGEIAEAMAKRYPEVRVVHNEVNLRQGGSLGRGFALARYELVTHNAMDYPFDYAGLPALLAPFPGADVVVAARRSYTGISAARRGVSDVNRALLRTLFGARITDYNFIQIYKRSVLQQMTCFSTSTPFITAEKIIRAHYAGLNVVEITTDYLPRLTGTPSSANWPNIRAALRDMGRLWLELHLRGR